MNVTSLCDQRLVNLREDSLRYLTFSESLPITGMSDGIIVLSCWRFFTAAMAVSIDTEIDDEQF